MIKPGHFHANEEEDESQSILQVVEAGCHPCEQEEQRPQPQNRKDIGGEDNERLPGDAEDCRNAIHGKDDVGDLDEYQRDQERGPKPTASVTDEELLTMEILRNRDQTPE